MRIYQKLTAAWQQQNSLLCIGLDPDADKLPAYFSKSKQPYLEFCRMIVDATAPHACAFKPQAAHFAAKGREQELQLLISYIRTNYPKHVVILDAKRGDIGSTAAYYAEEAFERYAADAVTLSPYLGYESVAPYLAYGDKGIIVLCRTSNADSSWLQNDSRDAEPVFEKVARRVAQWNTDGQCMLVAGATYPEELARIRSLVGHMPLLVPGIGAQGGDLAQVIKHGLDEHKTGLLISSSRGILYPANDPTESCGAFEMASANAAKSLKSQINDLINNL